MFYIDVYLWQREVKIAWDKEGDRSVTDAKQTEL